MAITNTSIFGIMFEVGLLIASLKISTLVTNLLKHMQNDSCNFVDGIIGLCFLAYMASFWQYFFCPLIMFELQLASSS